MRIPRFDDRDYTQCSICGKKDYAYTSKECLHKLCEKCYNNKFGIKNVRVPCSICSSQNEPYELVQEDYSRESPLQILFDEDMRKRTNIHQIIYKREENFSTKEEYYIYLEFIEKCIQKNTEKEIERRYPQNKKEREENFEKRQKELEEIKKKIRENSPMHYNSSRFCLDIDGTIRDPYEMNEQIPINYEPVRVIDKKIEYIKDIDKRKKTGGYDTKKIYEFLNNFSRAGFISKKNNKG